MTGPVMTGKYPYGAWLLRAAICDLVDEEHGTSEASGENEFRFSLPVYGNNSSFEVSLLDLPAQRPGDPDACEMTLKMIRPAKTLSKEGQRRAMHYILDSLTQRIENELKTSSGF